MKKTIGGPILSPAGPLPLSGGIDDGRTVFLSGQLGLVGGRLSGTIGEQTHAAIDNISALLAEAGLDLEDVVKTTVWLTSGEDFPAFNAAYAERFAPVFPARSTVVSALLIPGAVVEIEAIAVRS